MSCSDSGGTRLLARPQIFSILSRLFWLLPASSYRRNRQLLLDYRQFITLCEKLVVSDRLLVIV